MQLSEFKATAKPRNEWQAIDLGVLMARAWYVRMLLVWLVPAGLVYLVLSMVFWEQAWVSTLVVWWCKPLWERPLLYIASRELFNEEVSLKQVARNYWRIIKTDLLIWLTWRRLSFHRAFDMPVTLLEGLKGSVRRKRLDVLHRRFSNGASWLLITCVHIEGFLIFGFAAAIIFMIPEGLEVDWLGLVDGSLVSVEHFYNVLWVVAMALMAPFYVCSGFFLYLQRRIELEGWDIEIKFRQLAERRRQVSKMGGVVLSTLFCACLLGSFLFLSNTSHALAETSVEDIEGTALQQIDVVDLSKAESKKRILEVFKGEDFHRIKTLKNWRFKNEEPEEQGIPEWMINFADWLDEYGWLFSGLSDVFRSTAALLEFMLWVVIVSVVIFLIYYYRKLLFMVFDKTDGTSQEDLVAPTVLFGLDVTEEGLPEDVVVSARSEWNKGNFRQAVGVLLRSAIVKLVQDHRCPFAEGNTELECAAIVDKVVGSTVDQSTAEVSDGRRISRYFRSLISQWQNIAYAHGVCRSDSFEGLCKGWTEAFDNA